MKRGLLTLVVVAMLAGGGYWLRDRAVRRPKAKATVATAQVRRGDLRVTLPVNGFLDSAEVADIRSEVDGKILWIHENSAPVAAGELLLELDTKELVDQRDQLTQELNDAKETLNKAQADGQVEASQAQSAVEKSREALELAREKAQAERERIVARVQFAEGQLVRAQHELARAQRLAELHYIPGTKLREAEKVYRAQEFELEQRRAEQADVAKATDEEVRKAERDLELAQQQLDTAETNARLNVNDARIQIGETNRKLDEVNQKIEQCRVVAPTSGLVVVNVNRENWPERRPYRAGDDVEAGRDPLSIFNLETMQVRCQVGEMDISRVRKGQVAFVLSPAERGKRYRATVTAVEELARDSNVWEGGTPGKKVFGALVSLEEADAAHLRPGMTVDLEIVLAELKDATAVPAQAVFSEGGRQVVYVRRGDGFEAVPVTTATRSDLEMAVKGKLRPGEVVALARPPQALLASSVGGR